MGSTMSKNLLEKLKSLSYRANTVDDWVRELHEERIRSIGSMEFMLQEILGRIKELNKQENFIETTAKDALLLEQRASSSIFAKCPTLLGRVLTDLTHNGISLKEAHELLNLRIQQIEEEEEHGMPRL